MACLGWLLNLGFAGSSGEEAPVAPAARQVYVAGAESHDVYAAGGLGQVYVSGAEAKQVVVR